MKLLTFEYDNKKSLGILVNNNKIYPIKKIGINYESMNELICNISDEEIKEGDWFHLDMSDNMMDEELDDISIFSRFVSFVIRTTIVLGICCIALIFLIINVLTS